QVGAVGRATGSHDHECYQQEAKYGPCRGFELDEFDEPSGIEPENEPPDGDRCQIEDADALGILVERQRHREVTCDNQPKNRQDNDGPVDEGDSQPNAAEPVIAGHGLGATGDQCGKHHQYECTFGPLAKGSFPGIFEEVVVGSAVFQPAQAVVEVAPNLAFRSACGISCGGIRHCYSIRVGEVGCETE